MEWIRRAAVALVLASFAVTASADRGDETQAPEGERERLGYAIGYRVGSDFRRQGLELDPDRLVQGVLDALRGTEAALTPSEMRSALTGLRRRARAAEPRAPETEPGPSSEPDSP